MLRFFVFVATIFCFSALPVLAESERRSVSPNKRQDDCPLIETAQVTVMFDYTDSDVSKLKARMEEKSSEIEKMAPEAGVESLRVETMNYNIFNNNPQATCSVDNPCVFSFNGSVAYNIKPASKAADYLVLLTGKGFKANMYANAYRSCHENDHGD